MRLICFPPAAGLSYFFARWPKYLPESIEVCSLELSNREQRLEQTACNNLPALCAALAETLYDQLDRPCAFFGHCLGSLLAFETARLLHTSYGVLPAQLFLAGLPAPHTLERLINKITHWLGLPDDEMVSAVLPSGNETVAQLLQYPAFIQNTAPLLRRDLTMLVHFQPLAGAALPCPLFLFGGWNDHFADTDELAAWECQTTGECSLKMFPGDHLFPQSESAALLQSLTDALLRNGVLCEK
ncbi:MAG TPA: thioesterase domain-containing protein [Ktedonosporobacter sp.]|nr:thioesterase domain-containing protein [Ktedonosporobacter sp.]